jgi:hypothetical protein
MSFDVVYDVTVHLIAFLAYILFAFKIVDTLKGIHLVVLMMLK